MKKKELKFYEVPMMDIVELKESTILCASHGENDGDVQDEFVG